MQEDSKINKDAIKVDTKVMDEMLPVAVKEELL